MRYLNFLWMLLVLTSVEPRALQAQILNPDENQPEPAQDLLEFLNPSIHSDPSAKNKTNNPARVFIPPTRSLALTNSVAPIDPQTKEYEKSMAVLDAIEANTSASIERAFGKKEQLNIKQTLALNAAITQIEVGLCQSKACIEFQSAISVVASTNGPIPRFTMNYVRDMKLAEIATFDRAIDFSLSEISTVSIFLVQRLIRAHREVIKVEYELKKIRRSLVTQGGYSSADLNKTGLDLILAPANQKREAIVQFIHSLDVRYPHLTSSVFSSLLFLRDQAKDHFDMWLFNTADALVHHFGGGGHRQHYRQLPSIQTPDSQPLPNQQGPSPGQRGLTKNRDSYLVDGGLPLDVQDVDLTSPEP